MKNIQDLVVEWDGKPIDRPCIVRNMDMATYHSQACCVGPSVSSSNIRKAEDRSLLHAYREWSGNPNRKPEEDTPHFGFGRALHEVATGNRKEFERLFVVRPPEFDSYRTKAAQQWRAEAMLNGKTPLLPEEMEAMAGIMDQLANHPNIKAGILTGLIEHSIFWQDAETGIWCKSRPDVIPIGGGLVVDLKTTTDASRRGCEKAITEFGYHIQLGMVDEGLKALGLPPAEEYVLLFVEKADPWALNHKPLPFYDIEYGRRQLRRQLRTWAAAIETGIWPGYEDDEVEGGLQKWKRDQLKWEAENKLLPALLDAPEEEAL